MMFAKDCVYPDHCEHCRDEGQEQCCWCAAPIAAIAPSAPRAPRLRLRLPAVAPWRFALAATALIVAVPVGIAAAAPVWNGADLAVLIVLVMFVAAFIPGRNRA
ncbi:hypothetical protein ACTJI8_12980 [Microbacterium sp. 22303]|uniref:hypothetical protein n=1 Tax=Microbacterium sp. 22303 TaxID=3453905 RepID=UPI003F851DDF